MKNVLIAVFFVNSILTICDIQFGRASINTSLTVGLLSYLACVLVRGSKE